MGLDALQREAPSSAGGFARRERGYHAEHRATRGSWLANQQRHQAVQLLGYRSSDPTSLIRLEGEDLLGPVSADEASRKKLVGDMVKGLYRDVFDLGMNSTQGQFLEAFAARGATGDTRRKAISFFLKACNYAGVQTGTHWKTPAASASGAPRRRAVNKGTSGNNGADPSSQQKPPPPPAASDDHSRVVSLRSGGEITLNVSMNPLVLRGAERKFFNALVDLLDDYEDQAAQQGPAVTSPEITVTSSAEV